MLVTAAGAVTLSGVLSCEEDTRCLQETATLKWHQWITGSGSSQFHFVDLLELLYRPKEATPVGQP
ncbi:hypothetical protein [Ferrimonas marina]|uniref:hypothetical protein n=1 Tax=Ferrimonas marina TaxID=299255 RepID=UPI00082C95F7|nr:hypothetical protein [Ferrimonas marina]